MDSSVFLQSLRNSYAQDALGGGSAPLGLRSPPAAGAPPLSAPPLGARPPGAPLVRAAPPLSDADLIQAHKVALAAVTSGDVRQSHRSVYMQELHELVSEGEEARREMVELLARKHALERDLDRERALQRRFGRRPPVAPPAQHGGTSGVAQRALLQLQKRRVWPLATAASGGALVLLTAVGCCVASSNRNKQVKFSKGSKGNSDDGDSPKSGGAFRSCTSAISSIWSITSFCVGAVEFCCGCCSFRTTMMIFAFLAVWGAGIAVLWHHGIVQPLLQQILVYGYVIFGVLTVIGIVVVELMQTAMVAFRLVHQTVEFLHDKIDDLLDLVGLEKMAPPELGTPAVGSAAVGLSPTSKAGDGADAPAAKTPKGSRLNLLKATAGCC